MKYEPKPNAFTIPVRVYYEDTDAGGDDELIVGLEVEKLTRVRVVFRQHVRRGDVELVTGTVEIACVNMATMTPSAIPEFLHSKLEALK